MDTPAAPPPPPAPPSAATQPPSVGSRRATFGARVAAVLIDAAVLFVPFTVVWSVLGAEGMTFKVIVGPPFPEHLWSWSAGSSWLLYVVTAAIWLLYTVSLERSTGQTVGKRAMSIRIVARDGRPPDGTTVVRRNLAKLGLAAVFILGIVDDLWALWDAERQTLHDKLAGTYVDAV